MNIHYISPSILPSRTANSVHVVMQCEALAKLGVHVTLYAKRAIADQQTIVAKFQDSYGVDLSMSGVDLVSYFNHQSKGVNFRIAIMALKHLIFKSWLKGKNVDLILSRNLYAAFLIGIVLRRPIIFETHQLEIGFRKFLQKTLIHSPLVTTITISQKLVEFLHKHHGCSVKKSLVLPDAAISGIVPLSENDDRFALINKALPNVVEEGKWEAICGYFGHLYQGRGIEIIENMAMVRPKLLFLIVGGDPGDVKYRTMAKKTDNIVYVGHQPHPVAQDIMRCMDVLLMPYQRSVSIGVTGHDTAQWMSPMKMFEYMASRVPIISSDLPVLREVLCDGSNALLVSPDDVGEWIDALDRLIDDKLFAKKLGARAHSDYQKKYTWDSRAQKILDVIHKL